MTNFITWYSERSDEAVRSLFSPGRSRAIGSHLSPPSPAAGEIGIGYEDGSSRPALAVLSRSGAKEALAWVATYAPEAFPLSQVVRVLPVDEYELLSSIGTRRIDDETSLWASVVLGEILSQGDGGSYPDRVPISRSTACYSFAVARASVLYRKDEEVLLTAAARLRSLEKDALFLSRKLTVERLTPIWRLADKSSLVRSEESQAVQSILGFANGTPSLAGLSELAALEIDIRKMSSGSLEQRVTEFERASLILLSKVNHKQAFDKAPMYLAAFAFWVGGGTSHISLLEEFAETFPAVYAWMGLFAGLAGKSVWDSKWLRGLSSVERSLRAPFTLTDPPTADLCWIEFELIASQRLPVEWIKELPKLSPKTLTVEIMPGATCQMRLAGDSVETSDVYSTTARSQRGTWITTEEVERLALATEMIRSIVPAGYVVKQQSLFDTDVPKAKPKPSASTPNPARKKQPKR